MRRVFYFYILSTLFLAVPGAAQRTGEPDTLSFTLQDQIVVRAFRIPTPLAEAAAPVDVIGGARVQQSPARSVSDLLRYSPGATVRAYGGGGSLDLVSMRGLEAEYTVVLLNGVRLNSAQITTVDLDKLPLHAVQQIEIVRGGYSALYGADALGGIVNIRTSDAVARPYITAGGGSFGYRHYALGGGRQFGAAAISLSGYYEEAANDYPFTAASGTEMTRARSNYTQKGVSLRGRVAGRKVAASLFAHAGATDAGTPGALTGIHQGYARQEDRSLVVSAPVLIAASPSLTLHITPSAMLARQRYSDPNLRIEGVPLDATYENSQFALALAADHSLSAGAKWHYGAEAQHAALRSEEVTGSPERLSLGAFVTGDIALDSRRRLRLLPSLRGDLHRDNASSEGTSALNAERLSPSLALRYNALPDYLILRARAAQGYRIPTFNQLYWAQGGNPAIRPEESLSLDGGLRLTHPAAQPLALDLGMFRHDIRDKIVWRPGGSVFWTPMNIRHVVSTGIEAAALYTTRTLQCDISAQWIQSRQQNADFPGDAKQGKQIIYVPEHSGALRLHWLPLASTAVSLAGTYTGRRFYTSTNDRHLAPYSIWDAALSQNVTFEGVDVLLKAELLNIMNTSYEVTAFFPMPGRSFRITLSTQLH